MNAKDHTRRLGALAIAFAIAAVAIQTAAAGGSANDPGLVARKLGSPDPREALTTNRYRPLRRAEASPGLVAGRLGSPDPRDTARADTSPSTVATTLGSPDPQEAAIVAQDAVTPNANGFDWGDFAIGLGFGVGLSAILAGGLILAAVTVRGRSVAQPLA